MPQKFCNFSQTWNYNNVRMIDTFKHGYTTIYMHPDMQGMFTISNRLDFSEYDNNVGPKTSR